MHGPCLTARFLILKPSIDVSGLHGIRFLALNLGNARSGDYLLFLRDCLSDCFIDLIVLPYVVYSAKT